MSKLEPTRTYSNPTATDVLRRLLDERGVEWGNIRNDGSESDYLTEWQFENNQGKAIAIEWAVGSGLSVEIHRYHLTPEQAIAATLGATDARPTQAESSGTCTVEGFDDGIDEALDGSPIYTTPTWYLSCGHTCEGAERPSFRKDCGRKVVDA